MIKKRPSPPANRRIGRACNSPRPIGAPTKPPAMYASAPSHSGVLRSTISRRKAPTDSNWLQTDSSMISGTACSGGRSHRMQAATAENAKPDSPLTAPARNSTSATIAAPAGLKPLPMYRLETSHEPPSSNAKARPSTARDAIAIPATPKVAVATVRPTNGACLTALPAIVPSFILCENARVGLESLKSRSREPAEQLRRVYYLLLPHEPNIGEQVVVELREPLALERSRIPFCEDHAGTA